MKQKGVFGGFICAHRSDGARLTYPIAMVADDEGDALKKARDTAFREWPVSAGYSDHVSGVIELPGVRVIDVSKED